MATPTIVGMVAVVHGIHRLTLPLAGRAVGGVRRALVPVLNIGQDAMAVVNGVPVGEDYLLAPDDHLEFVRLAGEKGWGGCPSHPIEGLIRKCAACGASRGRRARSNTPTAARVRQWCSR